ncbi:putative exostosin [Helianthus annuus]|nr:putative exostosin [Helianthus annuus]
MSVVEYQAILKCRMMVPFFPVDDPCPVCRKSCLDFFGEHTVHCKELLGFKYRHDLVRDVLHDVLKGAGILIKKEAPVNFLTDPLKGRSTLRHADILVLGWEGGKHGRFGKCVPPRWAKGPRVCGGPGDNQGGGSQSI